MLLCTDNDRDMNQTHIFTQLTIKHLEVSFPHVSSATKFIQWQQSWETMWTTIRTTMDNTRWFVLCRQHRNVWLCDVQTILWIYMQSIYTKLLLKWKMWKFTISFYLHFFAHRDYASNREKKLSKVFYVCPLPGQTSNTSKSSFCRFP